ncbi:MAG: hypothetical protein HPY71_08905 [Firmicutes bacterium]|nr:hypothetical protein [Bacillota bacterium]
MDDSTTWAGNLDLLGGRLCLDFANTVDWHASDHPREWLTSYSDLVAWSRHAGILTEAQAQDLNHAATRQPEEAASVLERAISLREALYRIFSAIASKREVNVEDIAIVNTILNKALVHLQVVSLGNSFTLGWNGEGELDRMLWPVVWSAAELLTSGDLNRVRECAGDGCGWLFLDTSKNRTRKWCSMEDCGNRAKARRHYRKTQGHRLGNSQRTHLGT